MELELFLYRISCEPSACPMDRACLQRIVDSDRGAAVGSPVVQGPVARHGLEKR
jgi:hypothetical protein